MSEIIKFRDSDGQADMVQSYTKKLGLNNDSATIRVLLKQGGRGIDEFFEHAWNVTQPLKVTEIDYFTSSLNIYLKRRKKELDQLNMPKIDLTVSQENINCGHETKNIDLFTE